MKNMFFFILCIIVTSNGGCIFDDNKDTQNGEYLDSYFPLNPDLVRIYTVTRYINGVEMIDTLTRVFAGKADIQGNVYYILKYVESGDISYYRIEDDILYRYYPENKKIYVPYPHEEPMLDFTKQSGESWEVVTNTISESEQSTLYTLTSTFIGTETVQVPGGTFHECARYDNIETWVFTDNSGEDQKRSETTMTYSAWYSHGLGLVKATAEGDFFGDYVIELSSFFQSE